MPNSEYIAPNNAYIIKKTPSFGTIIIIFIIIF